MFQRSTLISIAAAFGLSWLVIGVAESGLPDGLQFQVNTYTTGNQAMPAVSVGPNGELVIAWDDIPRPNSPTDPGSHVQARRFDSGGDPLGDQFQVNTYETYYQLRPAVATGSDGEFVVVWYSGGSYGDDSSSYSIQGQRYDSAGVPLAGEFQVNAYTTGFQSNPAVAIDAGGGFLVVWESDGSNGTDVGSISIQGRRFDGDGDPVGDQFQVNTYTTGNQRYPAVTTDAAGRFTVVWDSFGSAGDDTSSRSIQGQRYDAGGQPLDGEFQVNSFTTSSQSSPSVAAVPDGELLVAWRSLTGPGLSGGPPEIRGQLFGGDGTPVGAEFRLDDDPSAVPDLPRVAAVPAAGDFVVVWQSTGGSGEDTSLYGIRARRFDSSGAPVGEGFQVNSYTTGDQRRAAAAADAGGAFVVTWQSEGSDGSDEDGFSIQARRFGALFADGFESGDTSAWSDAVTIARGKGQPQAALELLKTGTFEDRDRDGSASAGDAIRYRFEVTNTGGVDLADVAVHDPALEAVICPLDDTLATGAALACEGVYVLTRSDADAGFRHNIATVMARSPDGADVTAEGEHLLMLPQGPAVRLAKTWSVEGALGVGSIITYGYSVRNRGQEPLTDVRVIDPHPGLGPITCVPPQGSTLPPAGLKKCKGACGALRLSTVFCAGDEICVSDCDADPPAVRCLPSPLAAMQCSATYSVTFSDFAAGRIDNTARVSAEAPEGDPVDPADDVTDSDALSISLAPPPPPEASLRLTKDGAFDPGDDGVAEPGDLIRYTFQLTNTGGVSLAQATVSDPIGPIACPGGNPIPELAPGTTALCTATYEVTQEDVDAGFKTNTALGTARRPDGGTVSAQASHQEPVTDSGQGPPPGTVPFPCDGDAYIVQNENAQLTRVDRSSEPFTFVEIGAPAGTELNNLGFRSTDGLLYAVELSPSGNLGIVRLDATGAVFNLGRPPGLPIAPRFDGGDVAPDGTAMYITANGQRLYRLSLTMLPALPEVTSVAVTGDAGLVFDWAVSPFDGLLYGGDSSQGELAVLDPETGVRTDVVVPGLPAGVAYGGAWFDAEGRLFLYRNSGGLFEIDLAGPAIAGTQTGPGSSRNDGAACIELEPPPAAIRLTKTGSFDPGDDGFADPGEIIDYVFDVINTGSETLTGIALADATVEIDCGGLSVLAPGGSAACTGTYVLTEADVAAGEKLNTATVTAAGENGDAVGDQASHLQVLPVPEPVPEPFDCTGDAYIIQNENAQLTLVDASTSPFTFVDVGGPAGTEINNLGFRSTDGLLYGVELDPGGNLQIVRLDRNGEVFGLGRPPGLPAGPRFDAGDVTPDGATFYIHSNSQALYRLDLTALPDLPAVTSVPVTGAAGFVFDWAVSPADGRLYGGDSTSGQLAVLDPLTGVRTDFTVPGLPAGVAFGAAWFDPAGHLFLYRNSGAIFEIDLAGPAILNTQTGPGATRNDGAACIP